MRSSFSASQSGKAEGTFSCEVDRAEGLLPLPINHPISQIHVLLPSYGFVAPSSNCTKAYHKECLKKDDHNSDDKFICGEYLLVL
jgi:hypothetical protein